LPPVEGQEITVEPGDRYQGIVNARAILRWPVTRWAAMLAELEADPNGVVELWGRTGVDEPSMQKYVRAAWGARIKRDPQLQAEVERVTGRSWSHWDSDPRSKHGGTAGPQPAEATPQWPTESAEAEFLDETLPVDEQRAKSTDDQPPFMQARRVAPPAKKPQPVVPEPSRLSSAPAVELSGDSGGQNTAHSPSQEQLAREMTGWSVEKWANFNALLRRSRGYEALVWQGRELPDPAWQQQVTVRWSRRLAAEPALGRHYERLVKREVARLRRLARG